MKKLAPIAKTYAARALITVAMTTMWLHLAYYVLGEGFSPTIAAVVFGYGLTDRFIVAAGRGLKAA